MVVAVLANQQQSPCTLFSQRAILPSEQLNGSLLLNEAFAAAAAAAADGTTGKMRKAMPCLSWWQQVSLKPPSLLHYFTGQWWRHRAKDA